MGTADIDRLLCNDKVFNAGTDRLDTCLEFPDLLKRSPQCLDAIGPDFEPTLFQCQDNKEILCKMKLCEKHQFIVKC